ncbi:hypothetical protein MNEG_12698 [Monoraphidium neglectum]|uniref:Uncharacterized protein n=1 Tax=Monoraphidium neglectum TaxID=145388 RepID=A0A0D2MK01_9CHLO|nr:hypothetical protein MNEG_12698 [Monoraphidium neglectum]KIY95265.1 hypothetical protein MNEG_12698 [Monoraphidium neglectum]|eukprot:XP_013894285.1 hypothetical protein MNEG_12698 [Monoraphidium neglectum]
MAGPAAALAAAGWGWAALHPDSLALARAMVVLFAISCDYQNLGRASALGRAPRGPAAEADWRRRHKRAARRVAPLIGDLPLAPPLAPLLGVLGRTAVVAGAAAGGAAGAHAPGDCWWLGGGESGGAAGEVAAAAAPRLVVSAALDLGPAHGPEAEASSQLGRKDLINLIYGDGSSSTISSSIGSSGVGSGGALRPRVETSEGAPMARLDGGARKGGRGAAARGGGSGGGGSGSGGGGESDEETVDAVMVIAGGSSGGSAPPSVAGDGGPTGTLAPPPLPPRRERGVAGGVGGAAAIAPMCGAGEADDPLAFLQHLPLYGRDDHATLVAAAAASPTATTPAAAAPPLPRLAAAADALALAARGVQLSLIFAPFIWLGLPILACAAFLSSRAAAAERAGRAAAGVGAAQRGGGAGMWAAVWSMVAAALEFLLILLVCGRCARPSPSPAPGAAAAALSLRRAAWRLLLGSCSAGGPSWIKWAQWSSSRRDLFPDDFTEIMGSLHDGAPKHSADYSFRAIEAAFGRPAGELFEDFEAEAVASGSIAQVGV